MLVNSKSGGSKAGGTKQPGSGSIGLPAIAAVAIGLIVVMGWLAYRNFGPAPLPPEPPKNTSELRMEKIYSSSGGDLSKLSADDRQWLHDYSKGREQEALNYYRPRQAGK